MATSFSEETTVVYKIITGLEQEPVEGVLISWLTYSGPILRMLIVIIGL